MEKNSPKEFRQDQKTKKVIPETNGEPKRRDLWVLLGSVFMVMSSNVGLVMFLRYTQGVRKEKFIKSTAVCLMELCKFSFASGMICLRLYMKRDSTHHQSYLSSVVRHFVYVMKTSYWMIPPAAIYFFLNLLDYFNLKNLQAPVYTTLTQLKVLTTGFATILILNRAISKTQWGGLLLLCLGSALVSYRPADEMKKNNIFGFAGTITNSILSATAGIYFEKILKSKNFPLSVWDKNVQMYFWSIVSAITWSLLTDWELIATQGPFYGYSIYTLCVVFSGVSLGINVSLVMLYGSTIAKTYAVAVGTIVTGVLSWMFYGFSLSGLYLMGTALVVSSVLLYNGIFVKTYRVFVGHPKPAQADKQQRIEIELEEEDDEMDKKNGEGETIESNPIQTHLK